MNWNSLSRLILTKNNYDEVNGILSNCCNYSFDISYETGTIEMCDSDLIEEFTFFEDEESYPSHERKLVKDLLLLYRSKVRGSFLLYSLSTLDYIYKYSITDLGVEKTVHEINLDNPIGSKLFKTIEETDEYFPA